jgi:SAM-dependent methyltransferase
MVPAAISEEKQATAAAFGYEWTHFTALSEQYRAEFLDWIWPIGEDFFRDKIVLDGGCGKGRHAYLSSQFGAKDVIAVDLSDAVDAAYANTRSLPNVHVIQADLFALPFRCPFDFAYSIGVIHHLPDPRQGFLSIVRHLKPGGKVAIWVYGREGNDWIVRFVDPLRTGLTSRAPKIVTRALSFAFAVPLYLALKFVYGPVNRSPSMKRLGKLLFYNEYLSDISRYSFAENYWNVFDHLVAPTAFYLTRGEVEEWFRAAKLEAIELSQKTKNSWRASALASANINCESTSNPVGDR